MIFMLSNFLTSLLQQDRILLTFSLLFASVVAIIIVIFSISQMHNQEIYSSSITQTTNRSKFSIIRKRHIRILLSKLSLSFAEDQ
jgi:hypothetical protein